MSNLGNIAIGLIVVGLLLVRQLQPRPARETSSIRLVLILGAAGNAEISKTIGTHHLTTAAVAWLAVSLMAGAGIGAIRAATVRIWRAQDGSAWRQGTVLSRGVILLGHGAFRAAIQRLGRLHHAHGELPMGAEHVLGQVVGARDELPGLG